MPAAAVHYVLETPEASSGEAASSGTVEGSAAGENYVPGVYVKFGNLAHFCRIDPVDSDHPLVTDGAYIIVPPKGTDGSVSEVRLYDQGHRGRTKSLRRQTFILALIDIRPKKNR